MANASNRWNDGWPPQRGALSSPSPTSVSVRGDIPQRGGAIRGIDDKFSANLMISTGSTSVRIPTRLRRWGFGPRLSLSYGLAPATARSATIGAFLPLHHSKDWQGPFQVPGHAGIRRLHPLRADDLVPVLDKDGRRFVDFARTGCRYDPFTFRLVGLRTRRNTGEIPEDCPQLPSPGGEVSAAKPLPHANAIGNITHIRDDAQQTLYFRNRRIDPSPDYAYDPLPADFVSGA